MKYSILLFDIDETLLDFKASEEAAFKNLLKEKNRPYTKEIFTTYDKINKGLWCELEQEKISLDTVLNTRFTKTFAALGETVDGAEWEKIYRKCLNEVAVPMKNALSVCEKLSKTHRLFVITNGLEITQKSRLIKAGLYNFFEDCFYSAKIGAQKPSSEFFNYVKSNIKGFNPAKALVIGDALNTDIKGGINAGMATCLFSPIPKKQESEIIPNYVISDLNEIFELI
ncbi:MAG: YjjG family noncanonical pyrimidine nucleotidase [Clostridiales bacterium]